MTTLNGKQIFSLGLPTGDWEPSGLGIVAGGSNWLFMVSDNGGLAKAAMPISGSVTWLTSAPTKDSNHDDDYESVSVVGGLATFTLIGVEGFRSTGTGSLTMPQIKQFNSTSSTTVGSFSGPVWDLEITGTMTTNAGMEAMTWVPSAILPTSWHVSVPNNALAVFMAVQSQPNTLYVYVLPPWTGTTQAVASAHTATLPQPRGVPADQTALISDMYWDTQHSVLWVLYDGGPNTDYLQALSLTSSGTFTLINDIPMPWIGCEGVTTNGDDLYFCTDDNKPSNSNDGVYQVPGFVSSFLG